MQLAYSNVFPEYQGYVWYYNEFESDLVAGCVDTTELLANKSPNQRNSLLYGNKAY